MLQNLTGWHALIILAIVLLVFGSAKLPALARGVGQSMRILKDEASGPDRDRDADGEPHLRRTAS
jgi:sec-independent protein translocase protein TatA